MSGIDEKYKKALIYTIRNRTDDTLIYVGSTRNTLTQRFSKHKEQCKFGGSITLYKYITDNDWTDWYCELYEDYPCNNKNELNRREGEAIRLIGTINKNITGRTIKEYYNDNKEKILEQRNQYYNDNKEKYKEYYNDNKEKKLEQVKQYYNDNKEQKIKQHKQYYNDNKEKILERKNQYYSDNQEKILEQKNQYYSDNKEKILEQRKTKVICEHCGSSIGKYDFKIHQQSKKCLKVQQQNSNPFINV